MTHRKRLELTARIACARIEEAGLEVCGDPYHVHASETAAVCTVVVRVPVKLIEEQHMLESDPIAIMRDKGLL